MITVEKLRFDEEPEVGQRYKIVESYGLDEWGECVDTYKSGFDHWFAVIKLDSGETLRKRAQDLAREE